MANQIKDIMTPNPQGISPSTTLLEAAKKMKELNVGFLPVLEGKKVLGVLTDRDIVIKALANNKDFKTTKAQEIMSKNVKTCREKDEIQRAAESMEDLQIRRLLVVSTDNQLIGVVTVGDIATKLHNDKLSGEIIEAVSEQKKAA